MDHGEWMAWHDQRRREWQEFYVQSRDGWRRHGWVMALLGYLGGLAMAAGLYYGHWASR